MFRITDIYNKYVLQWLIDVISEKGIDSRLAQLFTSWEIVVYDRLSLNEQDIEFLQNSIADFVEKRLEKLTWCTENREILNFLLFLLAEFTEQWSNKRKRYGNIFYYVCTLIIHNIETLLLDSMVNFIYRSKDLVSNN